jgi:hypothetical protein
MKKPAKKLPQDWRPFDRPGESLYEKESCRDEAILAKQRAARKASAKRKKQKP